MQRDRAVGRADRQRAAELLGAPGEALAHALEQLGGVERLAAQASRPRSLDAMQQQRRESATRRSVSSLAVRIVARSSASVSA